MRSLLGFWPVARMTNSVESSVPLFSWTVKGVPLLGKPDSGTTMRAPVTRLRWVSWDDSMREQNR